MLLFLNRPSSLVSEDLLNFFLIFTEHWLESLYQTIADQMCPRNIIWILPYQSIGQFQGFKIHILLLLFLLLPYYSFSFHNFLLLSSSEFFLFLAFLTLIVFIVNLDFLSLPIFFLFLLDFLKIFKNKKIKLLLFQVFLL